MAISDYSSGKVVATAPIGQGVDGAGYDAAAADAFASNADGTLTVIHQDNPDSYHVSQTLRTPVGSRNMGLDPIKHICSSYPLNSDRLPREEAGH